MIIHKSWKAIEYTRVVIIALIAVAVFIGIAQYISHTSGVQAGGNRLGTPQVTLNPGGGVLTNASDGLRFTVNLDENYTGGGNQNSGTEGQDGVVYRNTRQYCCSAGGPMINIGGELYGQTGPAGGSTDWSSIEVISTSGATSVGGRTAATGDSGATIRYTIERNGRTYVIDRTVNYYYPNDYVTDAYSFTIPTGNTEEVKFYIGGDTAPGSSDQGYGIMLTEPVRTIISLNTSSNIMFGFREIQGSRPFDGATSMSFYDPYSIVQAGNDIGFVEQANNHDAGLMMQWNLGSTPGTYTGAFEQFSTMQGTNLNATLAESYSEVAGVVDLNISIDNTELDPVTGLGYTITLPTNLVIQGTATNSCGGTLTAGVGTGVITLSGVNVGGATNCVVTLPVTSSIAGTYTVDGNSVSGITGFLTNNVGVSKLNVGVYSLTFATQGGTSIPSVAEEQGDVVTIPSTTRSGFTFLGWNTQPDGSGTAYASGASYTIPGSNSILYARWQYIPYTITFNTQGGSAVAPLTNLQAGNDIVLSEDNYPQRSGYEFIEWNTQANGSGVSYEDGDRFTIPAANTTLYAVWAQIVTVRFDPQTGDTIEERQERVGDDFWLPDAPSREGYTFLGWNTSRFGIGTFYEEDSNVSVPNQNTTYYAIWEDNDEISLETENGAPNNGDANGDGILDSQQANVTSFVSTITNKPVTLEVVSDDECFITSTALVAAGETVADPGYTYPLGMFDFAVACGDPGFSATVTQYFYDVDSTNFSLRKFTNNTYATVNGATLETVQIGGRNVLAVSYEVVDGGELDEDGIENGVVVDPAGPAAVASVSTPIVPNTGFEITRFNSIYVWISSTVLAILAGIVTLYFLRTTSK